MFVFVIKSVREDKDITLYRLSKETNISRTYLRKLERNIVFNPTLSVLDKIAVALNVNVKDLFYTELDLENLRNELHEKIDMFGIDSKEALQISQVIDLLINIKMQEKN